MLPLVCASLSPSFPSPTFHQALAAVSFLRALAGFAFPLFAPSMYKAVGYGWGGTILALAVIVVGCPAYATILASIRVAEHLIF